MEPTESEDIQRISKAKEERLRKILGDLQKHMDEIDSMKERLRERRVSFFSGSSDTMLEEIKVPPLKMLKEKEKTEKATA